jgi:hypothetical protein
VCVEPTYSNNSNGVLRHVGSYEIRKCCQYSVDYAGGLRVEIKATLIALICLQYEATRLSKIFAQKYAIFDSSI